MKIQSLVMLLATTFLATVTAVAQPGQGRGQAMTPEQRQARMEQMAKDLALSEEQKEAYFKIENDFSEKARQLRAESQGDFSAMRESMAALRTERDEALGAVLTEEQMKKYQEMMANRPGPGNAPGQAKSQQAQEENQGKAKGKGKEKKKKGDGR